MKSYKKLSRVSKHDIMRNALNSGAGRLRQFVNDLAKEYDVPQEEFWLLQQESYVDFESQDFEVRAL